MDPSSSSNLLTDAEEIIRKVTTMDISEIMLTQYQIQSIMWRGAGRSSNCKILFLTKKHLSRILSYHIVTTIDISEIMLTQYQIQIRCGAGRGVHLTAKYFS